MTEREQDKQTLAGRMAVVTRARSQASDLVARLEELGSTVIEFPLIELKPASDSTALQQAIQELARFDWIVFTSVNGVNFFAEKMAESGRSFREIEAKIGAVGPKTAEAITKHGKTTELVADDYQASGLLKTLRPILAAGQQVLLPRGNMAKADLPDGLRSWGVDVTEAITYENALSSKGKETVLKQLKAGRVDLITFTSSSTVLNFLHLMSEEPLDQLLKDVKIACIGPVTETTAKEQGLQVDTVAKRYTIDGLIEVICDLYEGQEVN
ncbi:hypothetical protein BEP19_05430 [Ammoniphilus oxalaticus]|uniref:Uroporphyrinogen-III synthase n=1 Tax=Ammoniphilus oxalaticus TaxID=66863 RepID=A0A419SIT6_9BACL|nr:uroporphyrinogen-III synthase [Ammoniphilus oxalaticus]RKD23870.1 hypothetical protein BEP19_05430 [Ammoniphilus oxalaticus]